MGGVFVPGLSGGERKRANIACELLSDPMLMLIDEPTSGLDAALAFQIMSTLKSYATDQNKTIVTTIHQPSSQIFHMFENVLLLADGKMAYYGHSKDVVPFFTANGLHCDAAHNPADFILDQVTKDAETRDLLIDATAKTRTTEGWPEQLQRVYDFKQFAKNRSSSDEKECKWPTSFFTQFKVLMHRNFIQSAKNTVGIPETALILVLAISIILLWWKLPRSEDEIDSRKRMLFFMMMAVSAHILLDTVRTFPVERSVINKERLAGAYRLSAYYLAKMVSEFPVIVFYPTLFWILTYFLVGLTIEASNFFIIIAVGYLITFTAQGVGLVIGSLFLDQKVALLVCFMTFNLNLMGGGLLQKNFQWYLKWINYLPFTSYGYDIILHIEFGKGEPFTCSEINNSIFHECLANSSTAIPGNVVLERTDHLFPIWLDVSVLLGMVVAFRLFGYIVLRYIRHPGKKYNKTFLSRLNFKCPKKQAKEKGGAKAEGSGNTSGLQRESVPEVGLSFDLLMKDISATLSGKIILRNVSGFVKHGTMTAILGPSGTGKTTLLNVLAGRIVNYSGEMTINNYPINKQIRRKMGYVLQQDTFFNNLTLRKTLQFTAQLRLPETMSSTEKLNKITTIINRFDLRNCQDTKMEVLSGGERKRASIACELLADPALLLVDEPTTGLDSASAFQMMTTLERFSSEANKTIVTTIHQPSSHIFHMFEKILLLAEGQVAYYGDPEQIVEHFSSIGLHCPPLYNPADFILEQLRISKDVTQKIIRAADMREKWSAKMYKANYQIFEGTTKKMLENHNPFGAPEVGVTDGEGCDVQGLRYVKTDPDQRDTVVYVEDFSTGKKQTQEDERKFFETNKWPTGFWTQYKTLTHRNFVEAKGRIVSKIVLAGQIMTATLCGLIWWQMPLEERTIEDFKGMTLFISTHWVSIYMTDALGSFQSDRTVITKERLNGTYRLSAYWLAKMTSELPILFILPILNWMIAYFMMGLPLDIWIFLGTLLINVLAGFMSQSFGLFVGALILDFKIAVYVCMSYFLASALAGGYFITTTNWFSGWMRYVSLVTYPYNLFLQTLIGLNTEWKCEPPEQTIFTPCKTFNENLTSTEDIFISGEVVLDVTEENIFPVWVNLSVSIAIIFILRLAGYLVLRFIRNPTKKGIK